jgi:choline dehydrogenase-like flavoprotein
LSPDVLNRPNLTVAIQITVEKILFDESGPEPRAIGVEMSKTQTSPKYCVRANREVILSAGAVATPHLLLLSGIGPQEVLSKVGIQAVKDLSQVGKNYYDVSSLSTSGSFYHCLFFLTAAPSIYRLAPSASVANLDIRLISSTRPFERPLRCSNGFCSVRVR